MSNQKYIDIPCTVQIIGNIFNNPKLLSNDEKYKFREEDFPSSFHKIVFGCLYNLYQLGAKEFSLETINDYLSTRPKAYAEYKVNKGDEYLLNCKEMAKPSTINYYYSRLKKMTLLRAYSDLGMDLSWLYDPDNIFDSKKKQEQEDFLDNASLEEIADLINAKIDEIKMTYVEETETEGCHIGEGIDELIDSFAETPAVGYPLYDIYTSTTSRGARLGKFYLRSAATNVGKTRAMIADACYIGCSQMFNVKENKWVSTGVSQSTLFIATEQELEEIQASAIAFLSGVEEDHIVMHEYYSGEWERIEKAKLLLKQSKIEFVCLNNFSMEDIENIIKKHIREYKINYCFFDYIHSSAKILTEIGGKSGVKNLREDNILFLLASKLKDITVQYGIFILSSTQLNASYQDSDTPDQNLLRGSKAMADRCDWGGIMLETTQTDKEKLQNFCESNGLPIPNVKMSIYKNRANKTKGVYLWMNAKTGICSYSTMFVTDWAYNVIDLPLLRIKVEDESAF